MWAVASEHEEAAAVDVANPMIVGDVVGRSDGRSDGGVYAWHGKGPVVTELECDRDRVFDVLRLRVASPSNKLRN